MSNAVTAPARAIWGWFKVAVAIGAIILALVTGWDWDDAEAVGGHLWGIAVILWDGMVNIYGSIGDHV